MFVYRNRNTNDEVSYPDRSPRLDSLPNWDLVSEPPAKEAAKPKSKPRVPAKKANE